MMGSRRARRVCSPRRNVRAVWWRRPTQKVAEWSGRCIIHIRRRQFRRQRVSFAGGMYQPHVHCMPYASTTSQHADWKLDIVSQECLLHVLLDK